MLKYIFGLAILIAVGCSTSKQNSNASAPSALLNGSWKPISQEIAGNVLPAAAFQAQMLVLNDTTYTLTAESVDKGVISYHNGKMDIYGKEGVNAGRHFTAIYKIANDQLTVCYNLMGNGYPESFETKGKPMYFMSVFKKYR